MNIQDQVKPNRIGWFALRHKDGWWVGTSTGVTCYETEELARAANTIATEREGRRVFKIETFTGANVKNGEHTPKFSAEQAIKNIEERSR